MKIDLPCIVCGFTCVATLESWDVAEGTALLTHLVNVTYGCKSCHPRPVQCRLWFPGDMVRLVPTKRVPARPSPGVVIGSLGADNMARWFVNVLWSDSCTIERHAVEELMAL